MRQPTFFEEQRMNWEEAMELTASSLNGWGERYRHWALAWSGGKDSTALLAAVVYLIESGRVRRPASLTVLRSDTRMELTPLDVSARVIMSKLQKKGFDARTVLPVMKHRFFVYMLGLGVPPPNNGFRWCTGKLKIDPMLSALQNLRERVGEKMLMLTGVRMGESAARDARIAVSCGKNGAECGQGWFQESTPTAVADTLAAILHWRVCFVWDWLYFHAPALTGLPTHLVAEAYGGGSGDMAEAMEANLRTGCVGCNLVSRDFALENVIQRPEWVHLTPLMELRDLYAWLIRPDHRLRKDGTERKGNGELVANPCRMGPITLAARLEALERVMDIQARAGVDLINAEEESEIRRMIADECWPEGWDGEEPLASLPFDNVNPDGSVQTVMMELLRGA